MKTSESRTLFYKRFHNACLCLTLGVGERLYNEVERLLTRLIMGTNLPVVTLLNDMLPGSAPCWGCDSSPAGARMMDRGGRLMGPSLTSSATPAAPWHPSLLSRAAGLQWPKGRQDCSSEERTGAPTCPFLWRALLLSVRSWSAPPPEITWVPLQQLWLLRILSLTVTH